MTRPKRGLDGLAEVSGRAEAGGGDALGTSSRSLRHDHHQGRGRPERGAEPADKDARWNYHQEPAQDQHDAELENHEGQGAHDAAASSNAGQVEQWVDQQKPSQAGDHKQQARQAARGAPNESD